MIYRGIPIEVATDGTLQVTHAGQTWARNSLAEIKDLIDAICPL